MKRTIAAALMGACILSMTGCSLLPLPRTVPEREQPKTKTEQQEEEETPGTEPEEKETPKEETTPSGGNEIVDAIDGSKTSDTSAIPLGDWGATAMYAVEDETYHTIYVKLDQVTTQSEDADYVQSVVDEHNKVSYDFQQIDLAGTQIPDDVEFCVLDYEIMIPDTFPAPEYGIGDISLMWSQSNIGGGGIPASDGSTYIGLGSNNTDLATEVDPTYTPGNTYKLRTLFTMVKGYEDYVFQYTSYPDGTTETSADVMYTANFACK